MKKVITTKIPAQRAKTKNITVAYCDICDVHAGSRAVYKCSICDRDICWAHQSRDSRQDGDYRDSVCSPLCDGLITKYMAEYNAIQEEAWQKEDELNAKIKKESLESS